MTKTAATEIHIRPNKGPQTHYVGSGADITIFGGSAGPGKSWGTVFRMGVHADRYPGYAGIIFRRVSNELTGGGSLWEEARKLYPIWSARPREGQFLDWRFKNGSMVEFGALQYASDVYKHHGKQYAEVAFDELTTFEESQFWYLQSRLRSLCGMRPKLVATCNPDPDSFVRKLVDWWIGEDGFARDDRANVKRYFVRQGDAMIWGSSPAECLELHPGADQRPMSLRFIPAKLSDNPRGDPSYADRLKSLPLVERERLLGGNWNVRAAAGLVFKREWFDVIDRVPGDAVRTIRAWDLAATPVTPQSPDPDWTRGIKVSKHSSGLYVVQDLVRTRARPHDVEQLMLHTARVDGRGVEIALWQDPGAAGKSEAERYTKLLAGAIVHIEKAALDKETYARATSSQAEAGNVKLLRGEWNDEYLAEHQSFPDGKHDDIVDAESLAMLKLTAETWQPPQGVRMRLRG